MSYLLPGLTAMLLLSAFMFVLAKNAAFAELQERARRGKSRLRVGSE